MQKNFISFSLIGLLLLTALTGFQQPQSRTQQIVDETKTLDPGYYWSNSVEMDEGTSVDIQLSVESGPAIDFYVMDEDNFEQFENENFEQVEYYSSPSGESTQDLSSDFEAPKDGTFYFVVDNTYAGEATPDGESVDVHLKIEQTGGGLLALAVIGGIIVAVIVFLVWYFKLRGKKEE